MVTDLELVGVFTHVLQYAYATVTCLAGIAIVRKLSARGVGVNLAIPVSVGFAVLLPMAVVFAIAAILGMLAMVFGVFALFFGPGDR